MRKVYLLLATVLLLSLPTACSDNPVGPPKDTYVMQDGVELVDIRDLLDNRTLRWELNGTTPELWVRKSLSNKGDASPFQVGDVLYCIPDMQVPSVVFHKVTGWTTSSREVDYYLVRTEQADLIDVYQEASIHKWIPLEAAAEEYHISDPTISLGAPGVFTLVNTELDSTSSACSGSNKSKIKITRGIVKLDDPVLRLDIEIRNSTLREFSAVTQSRNSLDCDLDLILDMSVGCSWSKTLVKLERRTTVQAGIVPILVKLTFAVDVGFGVGGGVKANLQLDNYKADISTTAGIVYQNDTGVACNPESDCYTPVTTYKVNSWKADTDPLMEAEVEVECQAFVKESVGVTFYEVVGPQFWAKQYLKGSGTYPGDGCGWNEALARVVVGNDFGGALTCKIGKKTMFKWEPYDFKPIEKELWRDCVTIF